MQKVSHCGDHRCGTSTGIDEQLTFGHGELNEFGFWEFECKVCEDEWLTNRAPELREEMIQESQRENCWPRERAITHLQRQHEWLFQ